MAEWLTEEDLAPTPAPRPAPPAPTLSPLATSRANRRLQQVESGDPYFTQDDMRNVMQPQRPSLLQSYGKGIGEGFAGRALRTIPAIELGHQRAYGNLAPPEGFSGKLAQGAGKLMGDTPAYIAAGGAVGALGIGGMAAGGTIAARTGAAAVESGLTFGLADAAGETMRQAQDEGRLDPRGILSAGARGVTTGAFLGPMTMAPGMTKLPAEIAGLTLGGMAHEGRVPTGEDVALNTVLVGLLHAGGVLEPMQKLPEMRALYRAVQHGRETGQASKALQAIRQSDPQTLQAFVAGIDRAVDGTATLEEMGRFVRPETWQAVRDAQTAMGEARASNNPEFVTRAEGMIESSTAQLRREVSSFQQDFARTLARARDRAEFDPEIPGAQEQDRLRWTGEIEREAAQLAETQQLEQRPEWQPATPPVIGEQPADLSPGSTEMVGPTGEPAQHGERVNNLLLERFAMEDDARTATPMQRQEIARRLKEIDSQLSALVPSGGQVLGPRGAPAPTESAGARVERLTAPPPPAPRPGPVVALPRAEDVGSPTEREAQRWAADWTESRTLREGGPGRNAARRYVHDELGWSNRQIRQMGSAEIASVIQRRMRPEDKPSLARRLGGGAEGGPAAPPTTSAPPRFSPPGTMEPPARSEPVPATNRPRLVAATVPPSAVAAVAAPPGEAAPSRAPVEIPQPERLSPPAEPEFSVKEQAPPAAVEAAPAAPVRQVRRAASDDAFRRMLAGKERPWAEAWNAFYESKRGDSDEVKTLRGDPEFMRLYDAAFTATAVPQKRAAIREFLTKYGPEFLPEGRSPTEIAAPTAEIPRIEPEVQAVEPRKIETKLVTESEANDAREVLRKALSGKTLYSLPGPLADPAVARAAIKLAVYHVERIVRELGHIAKDAWMAAVRSDLEGYGATVNDSYLERIWNRPEMERARAKFAPQTRAAMDEGPQALPKAPRTGSRWERSAVAVPPEGLPLSDGERAVLGNGDEAAARLLGRQGMAAEEFSALAPGEKVVHLGRRVMAARSYQHLENIFTTEKYGVSNLPDESFEAVVAVAARRMERSGAKMPPALRQAARRVDGPPLPGLASGKPMRVRTVWRTAPARTALRSLEILEGPDQMRGAWDAMKREWNVLTDAAARHVFVNERGRSYKPDSIDDQIVFELADNPEGNPQHLLRPTVTLADGTTATPQPHHRRAAALWVSLAEDFRRRQGLPEESSRKYYITHLVDRAMRFEKAGDRDRASIHAAAEKALGAEYTAAAVDRMLPADLNVAKAMQIRDRLRQERHPKTLKSYNRAVETILGADESAGIPGKLRQPFLKKREGGTPYKRSAIGAYEAYVRYALRKIHLEPVVEYAKDIVEALPGKGGVGGTRMNQREYAEQWMGHILGEPAASDRFMDSRMERLAEVTGGRLLNVPVLKWLFRPRLATRASAAINRAQYFRLLAFALDSGVTNLTQAANTVAEFGVLRTLGSYARLPFNVGAVRRAGLMAEFEPFFGGPRDVFHKGLSTIERAALSPFTVAEFVNRGAAFLAGLSEAKAKGLSFTDGMKLGRGSVSEWIEKERPEALRGTFYTSPAEWYAREKVLNTQFGYSPVESAPVFGKPSGRVLLQFWSYPTQQTAFLYDGIVSAARNREYSRGLRFLALLGFSTVAAEKIGRVLGFDVSNLWSAWGILPRGFGPNVELAWNLWKMEAGDWTAREKLKMDYGEDPLHWFTPRAAKKITGMSHKKLPPGSPYRFLPVRPAEDEPSGGPGRGGFRYEQRGQSRQGAAR